MKAGISLRSARAAHLQAFDHGGHTLGSEFDGLQKIEKATESPPLWYSELCYWA